MMAEDTTLDGGYGAAGLTLTGNDAANLRKAGKWARFTGLTLIVIIVLSTIPYLFLGGAAAFDAPGSPLAGFGTILIIIMVLVTAFAVYIYYLLYDFGRNAVAAVDQHDQTAVSKSLASLSTLYTIFGVITAIYLLIIGGVFLVGIAGGLFGALTG